MGFSTHPAEPENNCDKFTGRAEAYALYRERYLPEIVLPPLREWCGLTPTMTVADIGAGTGMLGDAFRLNGNAVIAVEPNAEMRSLCKELHAADAAFHVIAGSAEETTLPDASVDMITVGRALHWFNMDQALPEFRRILKPSGWVVIVASGREGSGRAENEAFEMLLRTGANTQESTRASYVVYDQLDKFFAKGTLHHTEIPGEMHVDWNELRGLTLSTSHAPLPESENFAAFERALEEFFQRFQNEGKLTLATRTWMNAGRFE